MDALTQLRVNTSQGLDFVDDADDGLNLNDPLVRIIAYYLPQFHPIPENDEWWGKGFTEWRNVTKALPQFEGHYQPRLPGGLGFYDLRLPDVLKAQATLAQKYGITAFCFHRYWFNGKTLLETPLQILLQHPEIEIEFCINWANENWSRRWDGGNKEILMEQHYSAADDIAFAESMEPYFMDRRYLRIDGRPLLLIYRPDLLPDAKATIQRWRDHFIGKGLENPYIAMPQVFDCIDPRPFGLDAAVGFPPHYVGFHLPNIKQEFAIFNPEFRGLISSYDSMVEFALKNNPSDFKYFPGVCPSWDNQARQPGGGFCFVGSTLSKYGAWLNGACEQALSNPNPQERIVFVNAWNEWAEGAYLEPDLKYGYAYLAMTREVVAGLSEITGQPANDQTLADIELERSKLRIPNAQVPLQRRVFRKLARLLAEFLDRVSKYLLFLSSEL